MSAEREGGAAAAAAAAVASSSSSGQRKKVYLCGWQLHVRETTTIANDWTGGFLCPSLLAFVCPVLPALSLHHCCCCLGWLLALLRLDQ
jgi:hypothetical protein